jgi:hypothetical protein
MFWVRRALTVARRLAIRQARVRISARHPRGKINKKSGSVHQTFKDFQTCSSLCVSSLEVFAGFLNCEF